MSEYLSSHRRSFTISTGTFMVERRVAGFVENDGRWILTHLPETRWTTSGELRISRQGLFVGVFDTEADAERAARFATQQPACDEPATMGRVSC